MKKGSKQYLERERRRREMGILSDGSMQAAGEDSGSMELDRPPAPEPVQKEEKKPETMGEAYDAVAPAIRNYRDRMRKEDKAKEVRDIIEDGLGRPVSLSDLDDEIRDVGITVDTMTKEAVRDHRDEFLDRCNTPQADTNDDGTVDEDDEPLMTPGMRRMARYI